MNLEISDHCPLLITFQDSQPSGKLSFKLFNIWIEHESFLPMVEEEWKKSHKHGKMKEVWVKLKALQPVLRHLDNTQFKLISQKIDKARNDLSKIQKKLANKMTDELVDQEKETLINMEKCGRECTATKSKDKMDSVG